jgi:phosphatidylinositol alpha-1,6-mannosyltransferase
VGLIGPRLHRPYALVLHGAEITVPGRAPVSRAVLGRVLRGAAEVVAAGEYPADEAERAARRGLPVTVVPPGVDVDRFRPLTADERADVRRRLDLPLGADSVQPS